MAALAVTVALNVIGGDHPAPSDQAEGRGEESGVFAKEGTRFPRP